MSAVTVTAIMCEPISASCTSHTEPGRLERILAAQLADIRRDGDEHFSALADEFLKLSSCINTLASMPGADIHAAETKASLNKLIGELQFGDALSQRLSHLQQVLEARAASISPEEATSLLLRLYTSEQEKAVHHRNAQDTPECTG